MRVAFWRRPVKSEAVVTVENEATVAPSAPEREEAQPRHRFERIPPQDFDQDFDQDSDPGALDLRAVGRALRDRKMWVLLPTLAAAALSIVAVNMVTPRFKSEARILIDGRENVFLRANADRAEERATVDTEAVTSQVQLVLSREIAREVISRNKLNERPEFDPVLRGVSPLKSLLALVGIGRDPFRLTPEERVLDAYYDRLAAYAVDKSRVIAIEFQSQDPELAARVANSIADAYLVFQQSSKQDQARTAGQWLSGEIDNLRKKVADAESHVEDFRSKTNLFVGTNNTTLSNQQLGEINTQLTNARGQKSDAESKAKLIREMLQSGKPIEASDVLNSELVRRLTEQRITLQAQLAEQSSTLLSGHPRIKELKAQIADLDRQLRDEASKISRSLENDARISGARVDSLGASLEQLKRQASSSNGQDVQLRALEREAKAQRDLLESYLAKYREASARESIDAMPSDARIISRAIVSNVAAFPKKLPIVLIATLATLMVSSGLIAGSALLKISTPRRTTRLAEPRVGAPEPTPVMPVVAAPPIAPPAAPAMLPPERQPAPRIEPEAAAVVPPPPAWHPELAAPVTEIEAVANELRAEGDRARKVTVLGVGQNESVTLTALTLSRLLSRSARVVLVELSISSPTVGAISHDPMAPGLSDLMLGSASFGQIISRDRLSQVHLVGAGRASKDRSILQSPRLAMAIEALLQAYDHVVLDAGTAADLPASLLSGHAHAVVIPDPAMTAHERATMATQLNATGFVGVSMLSGPADPLVSDTHPVVAAA